MTDAKDGEGPQSGPQPGPEGGPEVGSVAEEAAKLFGALSGWAKDQGAGMGQGVSDAAGAAAHDVGAHFATGGEDCTYCPICRVVHVVRQASPEVRTHLAVAALNVAQAAQAMLATAVPEEQKPRRGEDVEKIDLADDWPEGE